MQLTNASAVVTGAASGLGAATGRLLASKGVAVLGIDLENAVAAVESADGVTLIAGDVTEEADIAEAVSRAADLGELRIAVNCAGIAPAQRIVGRAGPHDLALFRTVVSVNLVGTFNVLRLAAAAMSTNAPDTSGQRGIVLNTASIAGFEGQVGQVAYAASKAGVAGMTIAAARDLAQFGIRVNTIAPGLVDTPMLSGIDEGFRQTLEEGVPFPSRLARPEEYAQLAVMLVEHDYLNGETIRMDGALRMAPR